MDVTGRETIEGKQVIVDHDKYADYFRRYRATHRAKILDYHKRHLARWRRLHGTTRDRIRAKVYYALKKGRLKREPCFCGSTIVEAHHEDYRRPLRVKWYCRKHHREADVREGRRAF